MYVPRSVLLGLMFLVAGLTGWVLNSVVSGDDSNQDARTVAAQEAAPPAQTVIKVQVSDPSSPRRPHGRSAVPRVTVSATPSSTRPRTTRSTARRPVRAPVPSVASSTSAGHQPATTSTSAASIASGGQAPPLAASATPASAPGESSAHHSGHQSTKPAPSAGPANSPVITSDLHGLHVSASGANIVIANDGSIVFVGDNGQLTANTGSSSSSGIVALQSPGSTLGTGTSGRPPASASTSPSASRLGNASFLGLVLPPGTAGRSIALSGFEDHSVDVYGNDQIVTYDDSNVFLGRDGLINANTGDTDSSGLNAVDVWDSRVRSGNSGDAEGGEDGGDEAEDPPDDPTTATETTSRAPTAKQTATTTKQKATPDSTSTTAESSDNEDGEASDSGDAPPPTGTPPYSSVTDEGASNAVGHDNLTVGADGYDDVSIRTQGDRDIVTYDDSNLVIGGHGNVNAQIGDSDTGGAVVMGVHNSDVEAGCEGDLCYSASR